MSVILKDPILSGYSIIRGHDKNVLARVTENLLDTF